MHATIRTVRAVDLSASILALVVAGSAFRKLYYRTSCVLSDVLSCWVAVDPLDPQAQAALAQARCTLPHCYLPCFSCLVCVVCWAASNGRCLSLSACAAGLYIVYRFIRMLSCPVAEQQRQAAGLAPYKRTSTVDLVDNSDEDDDSLNRIGTLIGE